jgi:16S rRNA A1518/A1519 N6-dimethyltransferase RsmA/KsgA/DIM1 with predicted DNA glycosylase/AP lyase activity
VTETVGFLRFVSLCFRQKRKTVRNNLAAVYPRELVEAQPEAKMRAEQLSVEQLASLYQRVAIGDRNLTIPRPTS